MIWQALRMQCTARQQQIEGNMVQGQSALKEEGIDGEKFHAFVMANPHNRFVIQVGKAKFIKVK